jgi:exodeoxyribonuclease V alpha subunit
VPESDQIFADFCAAGLWPGLGKLLANALPEAGIRCAADVTADNLKAMRGIGGVRAERLLATWAKATPSYEIAELLGTAGLPIRLAGRLSDALGDNAGATLRADPWLSLRMPEISVAEADRCAVAALGEISRDDPRRGRALVAFSLGRIAREGHTIASIDSVVSAIAALGVRDVKTAVNNACKESAVVAAMSRDEAILALERYAIAEERCAEGLARLLESAKPFEEPHDIPDLDETQQRAVAAAMEHGVSVLTGGPGTGKSHTVAAVVRLAEAAGKTVALAAPTGRAAKRLEELVRASASTLHRLLGAQSTDGVASFAHGPEWPLEADLVVVDETSMLDVELAATLVGACADGTHLLLVGDPAQLPSIGPGRVLADIVESGAIPVTELTTLYRQAEGGAIARLATAVRGGNLPAVDAPDREVVLVPTAGSSEAAHRVVQLVTDSIPRALGIPPAEVQVVTPVHRGPAGTATLNKALKDVLNPGRGAVRGFDVGDRVVATANYLDAEPFGYANGEVGVVTETTAGVITVAFASGPAKVMGKALGDLLHGWAITVHRAQGSEWPAVVTVLPPEAGRMLSRPLIYTALTRAQRHLSIVHAAGPAVAHAVRRVGAAPRRTRLAELLTEAAPE